MKSLQDREFQRKYLPSPNAYRLPHQTSKSWRKKTHAYLMGTASWTLNP